MFRIILQKDMETSYGLIRKGEVIETVMYNREDVERYVKSEYINCGITVKIEEVKI